MAKQTKQLPLRHAETAAAVILVIQLAAGVVGLLLGWGSRSAAALAEGWHLLAGVVFWLSCLVHQRLRRLAHEEELETESLREAEETSASLFEEQEVDLLSARRRLEQFEKFFLPAFSVVIIVALGVLSFTLLRRLTTTVEPAAVERPVITAVVFIGIAFVSFLLARYTAGLAVESAWRPVRPGANYAMSCALGSLLVGLSLVVYHFELPVVERVVAYAVPVVLGLLALEVLLHLVMGLYRPRVAGQELRAAHDSRLLGMLTTSRGILRTTAETLDYQFGFRVSETWFFRFMERAIAPLILFQLATLYLLTSFVIVNTGEQAIIELLGQPRHGRTPLGPGLHLKWPWPIEKVYRYPVDRVEMLAIGEQLKEEVPGYTWTETHAKETFNLVVANRQEGAAAPAPPPEGEAAKRQAAPPVSLLAGTVYVYYRVDDLYDYLYTHSDPKSALDAVCYRELTRYAAQADFMDFLGHERGKAMKDLKGNIQASADALKLGVAVLEVTLQGLHPPVELGQAFEGVVGAIEKKEEAIWRAKAYQGTALPVARAEAAKAENEARSYAVARKLVSPAIAARFEDQYQAYLQAPEVFLHRERMNALEEALAGRRKLIKPDWANVSEVIQINLEDKLPAGFSLGEFEITGEEGTTP